MTNYIFVDYLPRSFLDTKYELDNQLMKQPAHSISWISGQNFILEYNVLGLFHVLLSFLTTNLKKF